MQDMNVRIFKNKELSNGTLVGDASKRTITIVAPVVEICVCAYRCAQIRVMNEMVLHD